MPWPDHRLTGDTDRTSFRARLRRLLLRSPGKSDLFQDPALELSAFLAPDAEHILRREQAMIDGIVRGVERYGVAR